MSEKTKTLFEALLASAIIIVIIFILPGCDRPDTTTVDRDQKGYTMPLRYTVDVRVIDPVTLTVMCRLQADIGCAYWDTPDHASIWISADYKYREHALQHEFDHLVYGPKHVGEVGL